MAEGSVSSAAVDALASGLTARTGFSAQALRKDAIRRRLERLVAEGHPRERLEALGRACDASLMDALLPDVLVGETFFFRQAEHFYALADTWLPRFAQRGGPVRVLSAGCASGEEAYSLAAALLHAPLDGPRPQVEVWGVDLGEHAIAAARAARYRGWSLRASAPLLWPILESDGAQHSRVRAPVRAVCRFAVHNLLAPLPETLGTFDVIFCRNVLAYFRPEAAALAIAHLRAALSPDGLIVFGATDLVEEPAGLERTGPPQLQTFRSLPERPLVTPDPVAPEPLPVAPPEAPATPALPPAALCDLHLQALELLERGERGAALHLLEALVETSPEYLPGCVELAVQMKWAGREEEAAALMREVLAALAGRDDRELLQGPEPLRVGFFRRSAEALIHGREVAR